MPSKTTNKPKSSTQKRPRARKDPGELRVCMTLSVRNDLVSRLDELAERNDMTRSAFAEGLLLDAIAEREAELRFMQNPEVRSAFFKAFTGPGVLSAIVESFKGELDHDEAQQFMEFMEQQADAFGAAKSGKGKR